MSGSEDRTLVHPAETRVELTQIVLPTHTNNHGTAFGGQIAAWCDIAGAVAAQRFCRMPVVTASMDQLHFLRPTKHGMVVILQSQVNQAWNTSMEVGVRVEAEDPLTGERSHCCTAYLTFVALGEGGRKNSVPQLDVSVDPIFERRAREAQGRRDARLKVRAERRGET